MEDHFQVGMQNSDKGFIFGFLNLHGMTKRCFVVLDEDVSVPADKNTQLNSTPPGINKCEKESSP